ncbi:MAG TPA: hypothetical protein VKQ30_21950 [Ktedonobacterales bacterium]|nr:hypothetical protein [Ktedonobacterales bacterium]
MQSTADAWELLHQQIVQRGPAIRSTAVGCQKADAVDVIGEPIRVLANQPGGIMAMRLANAAGISFAEPMCLSHESTSAMVASWANGSRIAKRDSG